MKQPQNKRVIFVINIRNERNKRNSHACLVFYACTAEKRKICPETNFDSGKQHWGGGGEKNPASPMQWS